MYSTRSMKARARHPNTISAHNSLLCLKIMYELCSIGPQGIAGQLHAVLGCPEQQTLNPSFGQVREVLKTLDVYYGPRFGKHIYHSYAGRPGRPGRPGRRTVLRTKKFISSGRFRTRTSSRYWGSILHGEGCRSCTVFALTVTVIIS